MNQPGMNQPAKSLLVVQHTDSEFLGRMEDHLEGRGIRFTYLRPHTTAGALPSSARFTDGLVLLGGGPWGAAGGRDLPTLAQETALAKECLALGTPVVGIGLGAQVLAIAGGGGVRPAPLTFALSEARRTAEDALNGYLPDTFPIAVYMRDWPEPPDYARILAEDDEGRPVLFQIGDNCFGFVGHPGAKRAMIEDLLMEFEESPAEVGAGLDAMARMQPAFEDALVRIMTGLVQRTQWMAREDAS